MKFLKICLRGLLLLIVFPMFYLFIGLGLTFITVNTGQAKAADDSEVFLSTNGIHLDIVFPVDKLPIYLSKQLELPSSTRYVSFGWGDENFYIHTPTWDDLTFANAFRALFMKSNSLMHVTRYTDPYQDWTVVPLDASQLAELQNYIMSSFSTVNENQIQLLPGVGYSSRDDFYKASGSYSCLNTCNTWVNRGFKNSGLRAAYWTPYDFGLIMKYE